MNRLPSILNPAGAIILELNKPCFSRFLDFWKALLLRMLNSDLISKLMYQHEVLRAEQEIRDQHLNTVIREVYENIGQILSLANMEVGMLQEEDSGISRQRVDRIGELVGKAIADLRHMSSNLYPDLSALKLNTLVQAVQGEVLMLQPGSPDFRITAEGKDVLISFGKGLILLRAIKEILTEIGKSGIIVSASAVSQGEDLTFNIHFKGDWKGLKADEEVADGHLTTERKIKLIGATVAIKQLHSANDYQEIRIHLKNCCNE